MDIEISASGMTTSAASLEQNCSYIATTVVSEVVYS